MNNIKHFDEFITEVKSDKDIVKDLARHLSFDRDVVKYLNTSRAKRKMGWRELLADKLHGKNLDYINYITKNMVADYNPQIVGPINFKDMEGDFDVENENDKDKDKGKSPIEKKLDKLEDRIDAISDILEIKPGFPKATEITKQELDLTPLEDKIADTKEKQVKSFIFARISQKIRRVLGDFAEATRGGRVVSYKALTL